MVAKIVSKSASLLYIQTNNIHLEHLQYLEHQYLEQYLEHLHFNLHIVGYNVKLEEYTGL